MQFRVRALLLLLLNREFVVEVNHRLAENSSMLHQSAGELFMDSGSDEVQRGKTPDVFDACTNVQKQNFF
jgi:hypothetical protein